MKEIFRQFLLFNSGYTLHVGSEKIIFALRKTD